MSLAVLKIWEFVGADPLWSARGSDDGVRSISGILRESTGFGDERDGLAGRRRDVGRFCA